MGLIRPSVWETADGKLHRDRSVARRHDAWLELRVHAETLGEMALADDPKVDNDARMADYLVLNAEHITKLLRAKPERVE